MPGLVFSCPTELYTDLLAQAGVKSYYVALLPNHFNNN